MSDKTKYSDIYYSIGRFKNKEGYEDAIKRMSKSFVPITYQYNSGYNYTSFLQPEKPILKKGESEHTWTDGELKFEDIRNAIETDSLVALMVHKFTMMTITSGIEFISDDEKRASGVIKYIKNRFKSLKRTGGLNLREIIEQISSSLFGYSNAFCIKIREEDASDGIKYKHPITNEKINPISRIIVIDLNTSEMRPVTDMYGNIKAYNYYINNRFMERFKTKDVIHIKIFPGRIWGQPILSTVIDDIRMLRRLEENMTLQSFQHAIPPFVLKLDIPASDGLLTGEENEILAAAKSKLEQLRSHGGLVISKESDVEIPTPGTLLNMTKYLEYTKSRVLSGMNMSPVMIGDNSGSKAGASALMDNAINYARYVQDIIQDNIDTFIINEFLDESVFASYPRFKDKIHLHFPEIDIAYKNALGNYELIMYNSGLKARTESRKVLGLAPLTNEQEKDTVVYHTNNVSKAESSQKAAPANQHVKKLNNAPRNRVNDINKLREAIDNIKRHNIDPNVMDTINEIVNDKLLLADEIDLPLSSRNSFISDTLKTLNDIDNYLGNDDNNQHTASVGDIITYLQSKRKSRNK